MSKGRRRTKGGVRIIVKELLQASKGRRITGSGVRHIRGRRVMHSTRKMIQVCTYSS